MYMDGYTPPLTTSTTSPPQTPRSATASSPAQQTSHEDNAKPQPMDPDIEEPHTQAIDSPPPQQTTPPTSSNPQNPRSTLRKLYISHLLSTYNARTFEFAAVLFLARIYPSTLFYASTYALCRALAAVLLSAHVGMLVDTCERLRYVRWTVVGQRGAVGVSCVVLGFMMMLRRKEDAEGRGWMMLLGFVACVLLACVEKVAFVGNTVAVERDWAIVVADAVGVPREELNSGMRRIDLGCKLVAPVFISLVEGWSSWGAVWVVFGQNAASVGVEYFAIAKVYEAVPELAQRTSTETETTSPVSTSNASPKESSSSAPAVLQPWIDYARNPAFLASFSLALLYLTVLSFASQMTTYLLTLGFTSIHVSLMRLVAVVFELSATCAAPLLMRRIGPVRAGLWFINEQLLSIALALTLFSLVDSQTRLAGAALVTGVTLSRLGLWGFDLSVQYLVQADAPEATRGAFSAVEASLQNLFEVLSFASTMVFFRPEQFKYPVYISAGAVAVSAACFAAFVRRKRGHLLHGSKCFGRIAKGQYEILPTIEEETELDELAGEGR